MGKKERVSPMRLIGQGLGGRREEAYVMKEVRASVCSVSALSAASRYLGILPIGRRIESPGLRDGRDGSNVSMSSTGVDAREASGVTRQEFALEKPNYPRKKNIIIIKDGRATQSSITHVASQ